MTGFDEVVAPLDTETFLKNYWLKNFVHIPGRPGRFTELLTWGELNATPEQHRLTPAWCWWKKARPPARA